MKNIASKLVELLHHGYATPQIARIAKKIREPSTTIHYNIKKLEKEKAIMTYKAVFDYRKIGQGFCAYALLNLSPDEYGNPERIARELARFDEIESVDIITGGWELLIKIRVTNQDCYYDFMKNVISRKGVTKITTLMSLKQVKTEFVEL